MATFRSLHTPAGLRKLNAARLGGAKNAYCNPNSDGTDAGRTGAELVTAEWAALNGEFI